MNWPSLFHRIEVYWWLHDVGQVAWALSGYAAGAFTGWLIWG